MKNMHFQGTRCSWCFQGPVLVQLCVASSKDACVAWVAVASVSVASGRSGVSKKRPRKQASIHSIHRFDRFTDQRIVWSCESKIRKKQHRLINKKKTQQKLISPYSTSLGSFQRGITILSVKRLALPRFQSRQHTTATSTQWWHHPAASSENMRIIIWHRDFFFPTSWSSTEKWKNFSLEKQKVPGELHALQDYSSCRGIHHLQNVGRSQGCFWTVKVVLFSSAQNCSSNNHLLRFKSTMSSMIGTARATHI